MVLEMWHKTVNDTLENSTLNVKAQADKWLSLDFIAHGMKKTTIANKTTKCKFGNKNTPGYKFGRDNSIRFKFGKENTRNRIAERIKKCRIGKKKACRKGKCLKHVHFDLATEKIFY